MAYTERNRFAWFTQARGPLAVFCVWLFAIGRQIVNWRENRLESYLEKSISLLRAHVYDYEKFYTVLGNLTPIELSKNISS